MIEKFEFKQNLLKLKNKFQVLTNIELAKKLNISSSAVNEWVKRETIPQKYLKLLDQDKENSIFNQGNNNININGHNNGQIHINSSNEIDLEICKEIKKLSEQKKQYFYHLIKAEILKEEIEKST